MKKIIVLALFLTACAGGTQALATTPEINNKIGAASDQTHALATPTILPTAEPIEPLPGKVVIPIDKMAKQIPWLPKDEKAVPITTFIGINSTVPPFDNPLVRKAFSLAINRQRISDGDKTRGRDNSFPATSFIPPQVLGVDLYKAVGLDYNPEAAKKALTDAGFSDVSKFPKVEIVFYEKSLDLVKAYQDMWKRALGVEVTLVPVKSGEELYKYIDDKKPGLFILGTWIADYIDPQNFTNDTFFLPDSHYPNPVKSEFEKTLIKAKAAVNNPSERQGLYIEAEKLLCEVEVFVIPVTHALISN